ncbi:MAG: hypothetical protein HKN87_06755 [Saprospiraceae bacterium]|nr:hypothetical protein [Saprospiraceae bacterium]
MKFIVGCSKGIKAQLFLWFVTLTIPSLSQDMSFVVFPDRIQAINHRIFGHFLERPNWGGEAGIEYAIDVRTGQLDLQVLEKLKNLEIPVLRFLGGTDIDYMDWTDMIDLPNRANRPSSLGNAGDTVTNRFAIDDFAHLVHALNCEAIIPLNFFDAFLKRVPLDTAAIHAGGLVAYANARKGQTFPMGLQDWPADRAANGNGGPHGFRYFKIGNETWALWSWKKKLLGEADIPDPVGWYITCVKRYVEVIEAVDPQAEIIVDYVNDEILDGLHREMGDRIDYYVFHSYMPWR